MADRIRVIHVDDDPDVRALTAEGLCRADDRLDVISVSTPAEVLERLSEASIDCVLADYRMPGTDGLQLLADVRDRWPELPFILYTAKGSEEVASEAISKGVTDYVRKATTSDDYSRLAQRIIAATPPSERVRAHRRPRQGDPGRSRQSEDESGDRNRGL